MQPEKRMRKNKSPVLLEDIKAGRSHCATYSRTHLFRSKKMKGEVFWQREGQGKVERGFDNSREKGKFQMTLKKRKGVLLPRGWGKNDSARTKM